MRRLKIDVLHAVGMQSEVSQLLRLPHRFRTLVWETTEALPGNKFIDRYMTDNLDVIDVLLVPSRTVEGNARKTYRFSGRTAVLPFWIDDRGGNGAQSASVIQQRFLFVGRMDEDKGFRFLIPAFERLRREFANASLDICGSGDPSRIASLASPQPGVTARANVSDEDLDKSYAQCIAVVLPSLHEGYPLSLLEACSFGKPVIATTVGSIPEVFAGRDCALLIHPGDSEAVYSAMKAILKETPARYAERCADARRIFDELCSAESVLQNLEAAYRA
jgi:glycosyltransferase involved in cell wall biosynthesis